MLLLVWPFVNDQTVTAIGGHLKTNTYSVQCSETFEIDLSESNFVVSFTSLI